MNSKYVNTTMPRRSGEPIFAIVLKGLSILSMLGAVLYYSAMFFYGVDTGADPQAIITSALKQAEALAFANGLTAGAIALWWMGEIIALLARIAGNGAVIARPLQIAQELQRKPEVRKSISRRAMEDVPRYKG